MKKYFILLAAVLMIAGCGKNGSDDDGGVDFYSDDISKTGMEVSDQVIGIKFNPPADWNLKSTEIASRVAARNAMSGTFVFKPLYLFFNDSTGSILNIGKVENGDTLKTADQKFETYKNLTGSNLHKEKISLNTFSHNGIVFTRYRIEKGNLISNRLIFRNTGGEILQFEYTSPKAQYQAEYPAVISSVGSIKKIRAD